MRCHRRWAALPVASGTYLDCNRDPRSNRNIYERAGCAQVWAQRSWPRAWCIFSADVFVVGRHDFCPVRRSYWNIFNC